MNTKNISQVTFNKHFIRVINHYKKDEDDQIGFDERKYRLLGFLASGHVLGLVPTEKFNIITDILYSTDCVSDLQGVLDELKQ